MPKIAVLLAAYNSEKTLLQAVSSVLASTTPVHLFIVDDGSRVLVSSILAENSKTTIIRQEVNSGLVNSLNYGLEIIMDLGYDYIARMDADDICYPRRFEKQLAYLENNPEVSLVGSWARYVDEQSLETLHYFQPPTQHESIKRSLHFGNCIAHPTWMMRSELIKKVGGYLQTHSAAEDYDFLARAARTHKLANVPEVLLDYRVSLNGISNSKRRRQLLDRGSIQIGMFHPLCFASYAGLLQTALLLLMPLPLVLALKKRRFGKLRVHETN